MKMRSVTPMKIAKTGYILMSATFCIVGILMIVLPNPSVKIIGICIGIAMLVFGIVKLVGYFSKDLFRLAFQYDLQFGILMVALGLIVLFKPENVMAFLCIAMGISILADGLFKIQIAIDAKKFGIKTWWMIIVLSIFAGIIGLLLIIRPSQAVNTIVVLLGISLLADGILNLYVAVSTVKIVKNQKPDVIETEDYKVWEDK